MSIKRFLFPLLAIWAALALIRRAFTKADPVKPDAKHNPYKAIDIFVEKEMRRLKMPGVSLAIVEDDKIMHLRGFGKARPGGETPTPQTPFPIGSLTKSVTALAIMQLVEAGKIELDAPVQGYLPWFRVADPQASNQITVRHLLNQTSGLPGLSGEIILADFDDNPGIIERQARALATWKPNHPAGTAFEYCNANYALLGLIIEAVDGKSYSDYIQEHILTPLEMTHTYTSQAIAKQNGQAVGHQYWFGMPVAAPNMGIPAGAMPGGGLISTTEDLARYMIAMLNGGSYEDRQILSAAGIEALQRPAVSYSQMGISLDYAMGWFVSEIGPTKLVWHGGNLPDFGSFMGLVPEQKKGVVLLFNGCHHWLNPVLADFGMGVAALLAGEQPAPTPFFRLIPWMLRAQFLIPLIQLVSVAATLPRLHHRRLIPERRPAGGGGQGWHFLLPLIPNLLVTLTLRPMLGKRRGYLLLYMPDYAWIAQICGSFALVWNFLYASLILKALRKPSPALTKVDSQA